MKKKIFYQSSFSRSSCSTKHIAYSEQFTFYNSTCCIIIQRSRKFAYFALQGTRLYVVYGAHSVDDTFVVPVIRLIEERTAFKYVCQILKKI